MNLLQTVLNSEFVHRIGMTLLHSLWEGAAIAALLWLAMQLMRRWPPQPRYMAGSFAMALLMAGPVGTFVLLGPSHQPALENEARVQAIASAGNTREAARWNGRQFQPADDLISAGMPGQVVSRSSTERYAGALPWIALVWLAGVICLAIWNLGGWIALQQMRRLATSPAGSEANRLTKQLSDRLGIARPVRVLQSMLARTPLVIGAFKPIVLLPASAITELSISELESIIAHELAHIRRHDFMVNVLQAIVETVLFYHPAVWIISARIRQERENCCDDLALSVTRDRASYVRALAAVASVRVSTLAPAASGGKLLPRLQRLLGAAEVSINRPSGWSAIAILLTLVISIGLFTRSHVEGADNKIDPAKDAEDIVWVHGQVVDPQGKAVAGAAITATGWPNTSPFGQARSAADGSYAISFHKSQFGDVFMLWESTIITAAAPGFGPGWRQWKQAGDTNHLTLKLATDDVPIEGRILDLEGRPVGGASVVLTSIRPAAVDLNKLDINRNDPSQKPGTAQPELDGMVLGAGQNVTTGADGKFRFTGIGRDRSVAIIAVGGGIAQSYMQANTRPGSTQTKSFQAYIKVTETVYGPSFDFIAPPGRIVRGTVRDAATHEPLAGVAIKTQLVRMEAVSDAQGHYELNGMRRDERIQLTAKPAENQPYLMRDMTMRQPAGDGVMAIDFDLHRGVPISGKITEKGTGLPVQGMEVIYYPYLANRVAMNLPEFVNADVPTLFARTYTRADGTYHMVGVAGPAVVATRGGKKPFRPGAGRESLKVPRNKNGGMQVAGRATWSPEGFVTVSDLEIAGDQKEAKLNLQCDPGITVHLRLLDADGKPVAGVTSLGHNKSRGYETFDGDTMDVVALAPGETRNVTLTQQSRQIGRIVQLKPEDAPGGTMEIRLERWSYATGRLLDRQGQPMSDAMLQGPLFEQNTTGTDANGHFKMLVLQGMPLRIMGIKGRYDFETDVKRLNLEPGITKDIGDVHANNTN